MNFLHNCSYIGGAGNAFCRKVFNLKKNALQARLYILSDAHSYVCDYIQKFDPRVVNQRIGGSFIKFRLFVNGRAVGAGPYRGIVTGRKVLHTFDVQLKKGKNVLGVISRGEKDGFALALHIKYVDGTGETIISDKSFKILDANEIYRNVCWEKPNISQHCKGDIGPGEYYEHIDGTRFPHGWLEEDFDDSSWQEAACGDTVEENYEIAEKQNYELALHRPGSIRKISDGNFLVDFGREMVASLLLRGPEAGGFVEVRLGEELLDKDTVRFQMRTGNCYQELWKFPPSQKAVLENFGLRAFRYVQVIGYDGNLSEEDIQARTVNRPFNSSDSKLDCSNPDLVRLWNFCRDSISHTSLDVYMDCPSRERIAYEGDNYIIMLSHFALENNLDIARRTVEYQINHPTWPCEWRLLTIPIFYEYLMQSGDYETVERNYVRLIKECSFHHLLTRGLIDKFPQKLLVDWPNIYRNGYEFGPCCSVPNAYAYNALTKLSELAGLLDKKSDAEKFASMAAEMKTAFNEKLFDVRKGLYRDHVESDHCSFHANMFALCFGLVPPERVKTCLDFIVDKGLVCSLFATQFYLEALCRYGRADVALKLMTSRGKRSWLGMIDDGATVTTEIWDPTQEDYLYCCSWAHPWGASPANIIFRYIFGLSPACPGWGKIIFEPQPGGLESAALTFTTPAGKQTAFFRQVNGYLEKGIVTSPEDFHPKSKEQRQPAVSTI